MRRGGAFSKLTPDTLHKSYKLCNKHFERNQFMNDKMDKLVHDAIPRYLYYVVHILNNIYINIIYYVQ